MRLAALVVLLALTAGGSGYAQDLQRPPGVLPGTAASAPGDIFQIPQVMTPLPARTAVKDLHFGQPIGRVEGGALVPLARDGNCYICNLIQTLEYEGLVFANKTMKVLGPPFASLFNVIFAAWVVWAGVMYLVGRPPQIEQLGGKVLLGVVIAAMLNSLNLWVTYVYLFVRDLLLGTAMVIVRQIADVKIPPNARDFEPFAQLYGMIENSIMGVIVLGYEVIMQARPEGDGTETGMIAWLLGKIAAAGETLFALVNMIFGVVLLLPFAFVMLIFAAYMVEGIFKFLAVTALAPLWIAGAFLQRTRGFLESAIRLYLSGGLTVVFASLAMGFTLAVTHQMTEKFAEAVNAGWVVLTSWGYWSMLVVGFISVLLHLKAATLASNISGANDGAGPAAATVMAGKMAVGMGASFLYRASGARGGLGRAGQTALGQAYAQGGLPGLTVAGARGGAGLAAAGLRGVGSRAAELASRFSAGMGR